MKYTLVSLLCLLLVASMATARLSVNAKMVSDANADGWKEYLDAFLEGAKVDELVDNSTDCVHDFEHLNDDVGEAISHFIQRGWTMENYFDLLGAMADVTPTTRTCYDVTTTSYTDVTTHFGKFKDFMDFVMQTKDNVVNHLFDWYDVYAKLQDAITRGYPKEIAKEIGRATNLLLVFAPKASNSMTVNQPISLPDLSWLEDFAVGFINGTKVFSSDHIKNCINETDFMVESFKDADAEFKKGTAEGTRNGVFEIADMFEHLKPWNMECYDSSGEMYETIMKYISTFENPLDILFNAVKHFNKIWKDIDDFGEAYKKDDWKGMGHASGEIFYYIFFNKD